MKTITAVNTKPITGCPTCGSKERENEFCSYTCLAKAGKATPSSGQEWGGTLDN